MNSSTEIFFTFMFIVYRMNLKITIFSLFSANARKIQDGIVSNSLVYFTSHTPPSQGVMAPAPLKLRRILDMVCITIL